jgi:pantothenate kinase
MPCGKDRLKGNRLRSTVWERLTRSGLFLDQTDLRLELDRAQIERFYNPLATVLLSMSGSAPRLMVAVAGPPGSGKTAFATILVAVANAEADDQLGVLVGLDGWHYPNAYLATHFIQWSGERVALRDIKGAPETFDADAAYHCLSQIRGGGQVSFPVYSRRSHQPIAGGIVASSHRLVVAEGNYLLLGEDPWSRFRQLFDVRVFISASPETLVESLRERHLRVGKTLAETERQIGLVDLPNARRVAPSTAHAHVIVHKADARRIERIETELTTTSFPGTVMS